MANVRSNIFQPHSFEKEKKNSDFSTNVNLLGAWLGRGITHIIVRCGLESRWAPHDQGPSIDIKQCD